MNIKNAFWMIKYWYNFKKNPSRSKNALKKIQFKLLKEQIENAYNNSKFYKTIWDEAGFSPEQFQTINDMNKIPVISKTDFKKHKSEDIITKKNISKLYVHHTSGSTGIPLDIYFDKKDLIRKNFMWLRTFQFSGFNFFSKTLILSDPCDIRKKKLFEKFGILRNDFLNIFDDPKKNYERIIKNNFDILVGYPIDLKMMAKMVIDNNKTVKTKVVFSSAELLDLETRKLIEKAFNAPVCDFYGSTEGGAVAFQTPGLDNYYVPMDIVYLEINQANKILPFEKAKYGEAIITNLWNKTHPVIRYNIGDIIENSTQDNKVKTKNNFPLIKGIVGKYLDFLVFDNDIIISPHKVKQLLTDMRGVEAFQVYQDRTDEIQVRVVLNIDMSLTDVTASVNNRLLSILPHNVEIKVTQVECFDRKVSKKFKVIESQIGQKYFENKKIKMLAPGPVNISEKIYKSLEKYEIGHREKAFESLFSDTTKKLLEVFNATDEKYRALIVSGSATCSNESVLYSIKVLPKKTLVISNGEFGERLAEQAKLYGHSIIHNKYKWGSEFNLEEINKTIMNMDIGLVIMVALETSTGMVNPVKKISQMILSKNENILFFVDAVSAFGGEDLFIERDNIDICTASAGKAIGALPGLSMICMSKGCTNYMKHLKDRVGYLNLYRIYEYAENLNQTPHTPAIQLIAALNYALSAYLKKGVEEFKEHYTRCSSIIERGMKRFGIERLITNNEAMSRVVISYILPKNMEFDNLKDSLYKKGFLIYGGKKYLKEKRVFQIAVMGELSEKNCEEFLKAFKEIIDKCQKR